MTEPT